MSEIVGPIDRFARRRLRCREYYARNREKCLAANANYVSKNKPKVEAKRKEWHRNNPEKSRAIKTRWDAKNRAANQVKNAAWRHANPERVRILKRQYMMRRRARKLKLLHPYHDAIAEMRLVNEAAQITETTGIRHAIDHIIPIALGGWHHHLNLQVLPEIINQQKHASAFWEMPGYKSWRDVPSFLWPERLVEEYRKESLTKDSPQLEWTSHGETSS